MVQPKYRQVRDCRGRPDQEQRAQFRERFQVNQQHQQVHRPTVRA